MKHTFTVVKRAPASLPQVIANYFDLEHIAIHGALTDVRVLSESREAACIEVGVKTGPLRMRNLQYVCYRPPGEIVQIAKTALGTVRGTSTIDEREAGAPTVHCIITTVAELELPAILYPFRALLERQFRAMNLRILAEDARLLERRQRLFGDDIDDYLADDQFILFKDVLREHFVKRRKGRTDAPSVDRGSFSEGGHDVART